jgi:hypothetical protein
MNIRWPNIMGRDNRVKMYFIRRPDGGKWVHVWKEATKHLNKLKGKGS